MTTRLTGELKREIELDGQLYTVIFSPEGIAIAPKGTRKRRTITWRELVSGDAELRRDLNVSIDSFEGRD
jgi:hypothetical protein